jgi:pimeloyl-ACP methyl ester carboxylesterase
MQATLPTIPGTYWQWRGQSIYYVHAGQKAGSHPPLLLVHGFGASTDHFRKNIAQLSQEFEVWAIDLLGFGRSAKPDWQYGGDLWCDQLSDFIEQVIGTPVVLAGNSLGGYASLCVAAQRPQWAAGLVLLNSAGPFTETQPKEPPNPLKKLISGFTRNLFLQPWASFFLFQYVRRKGMIRKTLKQVYLDQSAVTDQLVEDIYRPSCDVGAEKVFASVFKSRQGEKVDVLLQQMQCPLLILWGEGDPWMNTRERSEKFRQYYANLTEHFLNAGHCPHDEIPDQVNGLLRDWVLALPQQKMIETT